MFQNLFKTAWRSIRRDASYSALNLIGLTTGIVASLMIFLFVGNELSYDKFHQKGDRIYRIISHITEKDDAFTWSSTQVPLGRHLKSNYPEVEEFTKIRGVGQWTLEHGDKKFVEEEIYLADSAFFRMFTHEFIMGDPNTCLNEPNSLVFTESLAKKYFGSLDQEIYELKDDEGDSFRITAIIKDVPQETHFEFEGLVSYSSLPDPERGHWSSFNIFTYIMLQENVDAKAFAENLPKIVVEYVDPIFKQYGIGLVYEMQKVHDIYLLSKAKGEHEGGDMSYIYIFLTVGIFILILAAINYMNLATSRAEKRSKEVGIRKVLGSYRSALVTQFMSESILITFVSLVLALLIIAFPLLTPFNQLTGKNFEIGDLFSLRIIMGYLGLVLVIGLFSGSYPSFFLSSFQPAWVLKGKLSQKVGGFSVRKVLVVFQFVISIGMVISTWVVYDQLNFLRTKDLGFDKDQILVVNLAEGPMREKVPVLRDAWMASSHIENVSSGSNTPGGGYGKNLMEVESKDGFVEKGVNLFGVDEFFFPTLGIEILEGRNFSSEMGSDTSSVLVNELMIERMGWENAIGKRIRSMSGDNPEVYKVIGVFKNFHTVSLYEEMEGLTLFYGENFDELQIRFNPDKTEEVLDHLEAAWMEIFPDKPFDYYFLDQEFFEAYEKDQTRSRVFLVFAMLAVLIACLGLLGLASFSVERRSKEIGIRKVVGATTVQIIALVSRDFFLLVTISLLIAFFLAGYMMKNWLDTTFVYHTELKLITFILSALVTYVIVLLMVAFHSFKAANTDPVRVLKDE